jgi:signal transduction histidine kinase
MAKVLIIEDSKSFSAATAENITTRFGYTCLCAYDMQSAKHFIDCNNDIFVALVDLNLPDAPNGEAVNLTLKHKISTLVCTGQISDAVRNDISARGIADYILKQGQNTFNYIAEAVHRLHENSKHKVLIVEDSPSSLAVLTKLLSIQRFKVLSAKSFQDAVSLLEQDCDISLAIIDYNLPGASGAELTAHIRQSYSKQELAILGITAQQSHGRSVEFLKRGANDFVSVPYQPEELLCRINSLVESVEQMTKLIASNAQTNYLMGMAAHDIRGPLGVIQLASQRLIEKTTLTERQTSQINMVHNNSKKLIELLDMILELVKMERCEFEPLYASVNLDQLLTDTLIDQHATAREKSISLHFNNPGPTMLECDASLIRQVIANLISNAIKYSPPGSDIVIALSSTDKQCEVSVTDQGPGIKTEEHHKLFKAFQRLSSKPTGNESSTGLGLAICKRIINAHDGEIHYEDEKQGSRFSFTLPYQQQSRH